MYTAGGWGDRGYFLNGQNFLRSPPYHTEFFHNTPLDQKKILAVLTRTEEDIKVQALYFFEGQIPSQSISATVGTDFSGDTLDHVDCAFHYLEKQSVFDVDVDDVK